MAIKGVVDELEVIINLSDADAACGLLKREKQEAWGDCDCHVSPKS